jgi:exodeoxyribonuclease-5
MVLTLSDEQQKVFDALIQNDEHVQTLGGYAGTGKTTLTVLLAEETAYAVCAYTGKAAHVLRQKGCADAKTIHSLIYHPLDKSLQIEKADQHLDKLVKSKAGAEDIARAREALLQALQPEFVRKEKLVGDDKRELPGVIIDEASMVPKCIYDDLRSYGRPLIFVGDHGQLPPISKNGVEPFNLMADPQYRLEEIHRNAGSIAFFAEHIRKGNSARSYTQGSNVVTVLGPGAATLKFACTVDQIIVPFNATRVDRNAAIRKKLGRCELLEVGDRIICLRNSRIAALFNGMQGTVTSVDLEDCLLDFTDDSGLEHVDVSFDREQFGKKEYMHRFGGPHPFDYAYVITCHKAQGSEWRHVLVLDQGWKWDYTRWAYTAASRARERLTWITPH